MRFGLFGTGHWAAETHAAAIEAHPQAELAGVWGRDPAKVGALAARHGVPAFDDVDALLGACDAIAVALPPDIQAEIAVRAATAGRHLLLDKPLALSLAEADRVVAAAQASGVASVVFFTQRFHPNVTGFLASTAAAGGWQHARATMFAYIYQPGNPYGNSQWRRDRGALWDIGPHALSLILPVLGRVTQVAAMDGPSGLVHLLLTHDGGATSSLSLTLEAPAEAVTRDFVFFGENGTETVPPGDGSALQAYGTAIDQLLEEVEAGTRDHRCDVRFGREVVGVLDAAERARAEGRTVDLPA
ncbi:Gfo/Idh/MocA family oxidoreductase [Micromonospora sp. DR5-3]|uniref:Gfo/Idh/MocA family protein n=1 Tax=unclassified Micromonospora TaxID=2617518 RepID=UPI0011D83945|nr:MULTISPECIES: Gfo/Idh/MocA family oxidoreductase [unclassified Micromonospora]MCW3814793.1 Gfo/Idh/MocA family oxidoreductase [Micromonospora sp. DR5-3]TYC24120.1 Gfo/Idh/MocA family oxidoreductase [Micromonospora sp. MP36]